MLPNLQYGSFLGTTVCDLPSKAALQSAQNPQSSKYYKTASRAAFQRPQDAQYGHLPEATKHTVWQFSRGHKTPSMAVFQRPQRTQYGNLL